MKPQQTHVHPARLADRRRRLLATLLALIAGIGVVLTAVPASAAAPFTVRLCTDSGSGVCHDYSDEHVVAGNGSVAYLSDDGIADAVTSLQIFNRTNAFYVYLYSEPVYQGRCQEFTSDQMLLAGSWVGDDAAESMGWATTSGYCGKKGAPFAAPSICAGRDGTGCMPVYRSIADLRGATVGDDSLSSLRVPPGMYVDVFRDPGFRGQCEEFSADQNSLFGSVISEDSASSVKISDTPGGCNNGRTVWITTGRKKINHWQTYQMTYYCPAAYPELGSHSSSPATIPFENVSSGGVSAAMAGGVYGSGSITVTYGNVNVKGDQTAGIKFPCHNNSTYVNDTDLALGGTYRTGTGTYGNDEHELGTTDSFSYEFVGNSFELWGTRGAGQGRMVVKLRGEHGPDFDSFLDCGTATFDGTSQVLWRTDQLPDWVEYVQGKRLQDPQRWTVHVEVTRGPIAIDAVASATGASDNWTVHHGCATYDRFKP